MRVLSTNISPLWGCKSSVRSGILVVKVVIRFIRSPSEMRCVSYSRVLSNTCGSRSVFHHHCIADNALRSVFKNCLDTIFICIANVDCVVGKTCGGEGEGLDNG